MLRFIAKRIFKSTRVKHSGECDVSLRAYKAKRFFAIHKNPLINDYLDKNFCCLMRHRLTHRYRCFVKRIKRNGKNVVLSILVRSFA